MNRVSGVLCTCGGDGAGLAAGARAADVHGSDVDDVMLPGLQLQKTLAGRDRHDAPAGRHGHFTAFITNR